MILKLLLNPYTILITAVAILFGLWRFENAQRVNAENRAAANEAAYLAVAQQYHLSRQAFSEVQKRYKVASQDRYQRDQAIREANDACLDAIPAVTVDRVQ